MLCRLLRWLLPHSPIGDAAYALILFTAVHRRLPRRRGTLLNDRFLKLRLSTEIRDPTRRLLSDKHLAKAHVAWIVGPQHVVPTLAVLNTHDDVARYDFPTNCCIKSTHACGHVFIRRDGADINKFMLSAWLKEDYYRQTREPNYRGLSARIIVEPIIFAGAELLNYRIICVHGEPKLINVDGFFGGEAVNVFLDTDWRKIDLRESGQDEGEKLRRPPTLHAMLRIARNLSAGFSLLRVDLYSDGVSILVGEITNCHAGALRRFRYREDEISVSAALG